MSLSINSNKSSKSLLAYSDKILKIKNYLKIDIFPKPFDGYITKRKKLKIVDYIKKKINHQIYYYQIKQMKKKLFLY